MNPFETFQEDNGIPDAAMYMAAQHYDFWVISIAVELSRAFKALERRYGNGQMELPPRPPGWSYHEL